ncbi:MAG TPA: hypothetical protein VF547_08220 [Allosphingosinicella sp.]|jgi:hypothetical protein
MRALILAASMLLCAAAAASAQVRGAPPPVTAPAPELLKLAAEVHRTGPKLARLWPGFWPPDQAFIIYRPGQGALLVAADAPPPPFAALPAAGVPKALRGRAWFRPGNLDGVGRPFILGYPIGAGRTAVLVLADEAAKDLATLIFHEQFHAYQRKAFRHPSGSQFVAPTAVPDRVSFAAGAETERRILASALTMRRGRMRDGLLHQYLALRREREKSLPPGVVRVEGQLEKVEGTAKFIDRAAVALGPEPDGNLAGLIAEVLREDLGAGGQPFLTAWFRSRSYGVGAALTYLLRDLDPKGWRSAVESADSLDERLAVLTGFGSVRDPGGLAEGARSAFGYAATKAALEPKLRAAERKEIKSAEEFYALGAHRIVFEVTAPAQSGDRGTEMGFASGPGGMTLLGEAQLVLPDPRLVQITLPFGALSVKDRPFMSEGGRTSRYTILVPAAPSLNGRAGLGAGEHRFERLDLTAEGVRIGVERPVTVVVGQHDTIIRYAVAAD